MKHHHPHSQEGSRQHSSVDGEHHDHHHHQMGESRSDHNGHSRNGKHSHENHEGHEHHHEMMIVDFKRRLLVSTVLTVPVLLLSPMIQQLFGFSLDVPFGFTILFLLSTAIYLYGGFPFLKGLYTELRKREPGMMTLIAIAVSTAYLYSSAVYAGLEGKTFFWELATLIDIMLLGHWLEMRSILGAGRAVQSLAELIPDEAFLVKEGATERVPVSSLKVGDRILVKPGQRVAADGVVQEGNSELDESMITGESKPVNRGPGEEVVAGSISGSGSLVVEVSRIGEASYLSKVIEMVRSAQAQKSRTQRLADVAARWLTAIALIVGFGTLAIWLLLGREFSFALERMVTVMVISCPHALGLAIPLVASISTGVSARNGLLIRDRTAFESARKISTFVFDKTGTLTKGSHEVVGLASLQEDLPERELVQLLASLEAPSEHHIAKGLLRYAEKENIPLKAQKDFRYVVGVGVTGIVAGKELQAGGYLMLKQSGLSDQVPELENTRSHIFLISQDRVLGYVSFADQIRETSEAAIARLREAGIKSLLLTGDNRRVAAAVASELGMDDFMAEVLPEQKQDKVRQLQSAGEFVAMTGDGVNDAPALAQADVGIAVGSGTDVAAETADIILVESDPAVITRLIFFGRATYRKMIQNLAWATGYNAITIPLATGFIPGLMISPAAGAALMSLSTIICAVNAQLLRSSMK